MTKAEYEQFAARIQAGGFYTNGLRPVGPELFSTVICSKKLDEGEGFSGNSFWATRFNKHWYLGTWGIRHYQVPDDKDVVEVCLTWLRRKPEGATSDFDEDLKSVFNLMPVFYEEFRELWSAAGLLSEGDIAKA